MSRLPRRWWPGTALLAACAVHVPAPSPTPPWSPDDVQLARESAQEELGRWRRERSEAWLEYVDPGEQAEHSRRLGLAQIEGGAPVAEIFLQGESVFERRFTEREGLGTGLLARPAPALSRVENAAGVGGPRRALLQAVSRARWRRRTRRAAPARRCSMATAPTRTAPRRGWHHTSPGWAGCSCSRPRRAAGFRSRRNSCVR